MSQFNIDKFIAHFFGAHKGVFLETGSSHPTDQNNTYLLEQIGWSGMLVEPRNNHNDDYLKLRPNSIVENYALVSKDFKDDKIISYSHEYDHMFSVTGIHGKNINAVEWEVITLDKLLKKHEMKNVDFFSLDVEGYEHEVLEGVDFEYTKFGIILIETHDYSWNNKSDDFSYLNEKGYTRIGDLSQHHQVWINNVLPVNNRIKYFTNLK